MEVLHFRVDLLYFIYLFIFFFQISIAPTLKFGARSIRRAGRATTPFREPAKPGGLSHNLAFLERAESTALAAPNATPTRPLTPPARREPRADAFS